MERKSAGLRARRMTEADLEPLHRLLSDPEVMRYLEPPFSREQTRAFLERAGLTPEPLILAVDDGGFAGYVIWHPYDDVSMELGWVLDRSRWGRGYAGELTRLLTDRARRQGRGVVIECVPEQTVTRHIAEKSGFSATTVRRRVKLLELDKDKFKKSEERGVSLFEYMELDKLKSPERKNEMLDYIGTENFKYKLKQAINDEAAEARKALWVEQLSTFATQITDKTGYKRVNSFYTNGEVKVDRPEDADTIEYFFFVETWGYIVLMVKDEPTTLTPEEEAKEREEQLKQERKDAAAKALSEATARAYELRADFVATVSAAAIKKRLVDIVALWAYAEYWDDTSWLTEEEIAQATGAETLAEDDEDGEDDAAFTLQAVTDAIGKTPEKALLRMIYARLGDGKSEGYFHSYWNSYTMKHEENEKLDRIYALLVKLGYEMSDDEKALQDGTHELFGEATGE